MSLARRVKNRYFKKVFVVHGRNAKVRDAMFDFLTALKLDPIEWNQAVKATGKSSPFVGEILEAAFKMAAAVVVLFTPDDLGQLRPEFQDSSDPDYERNLTPQARPNVLFEAGMALGSHPDRTILVEIGQVRPFSDVAGRHTIRFKGSAKDRQALKERLKTAGCPVDDSGERWLGAGDFVEALKTILPFEPGTPRDAGEEFEGPRWAGKVKWIKLRDSAIWDPVCPNCTTRSQPIFMSRRPKLTIVNGVGTRTGYEDLSCTGKGCNLASKMPEADFDRYTNGEFGSPS